MTENKTPATPQTTAAAETGTTQPFVWLPIVGFLALTAAIIAAAYYLLM